MRKTILAILIPVISLTRVVIQLSAMEHYLNQIQLFCKKPYLQNFTLVKRTRSRLPRQLLLVLLSYWADLFNNNVQYFRNYGNANVTID